MNTFIIILIIIFAIVALPFVVALFVPKTYRVQCTVSIQQPVYRVYEYLRNTKNQDFYNKWVMVDPDMRKTFTGTDGTIGFIYAWDSDTNAGKGEQEIIALEENKSVGIEIRFEKPFTSIGYSQQNLEVNGNETHVSWSMRGTSKYPMNIINLFIEKMLGPDLQTSLNNLKNILETKA